jgi:hypothetical protein
MSASHSIITTASYVLAGYREIEDPVLRYSLLVDKLAIMLHIVVGLIEVHAPTTPGPQQLQYQNLVTGLRSDMKDLSAWIQHPVYSPDHPFGRNLMLQSGAELASVAAPANAIQP